jgi:hypothetical protein
VGVVRPEVRGSRFVAAAHRASNATRKIADELNVGFLLDAPFSG